MRIFLTGGDGQLGRELRNRLQGGEFLAAGKKELDVTDEAAVSAIIGGYQPEVVIHAAAWTRVDEAEQNADQAYRVNAVGTQNVAMACREAGAALVYVSTDYVFDGTLNRAYTEIDAPNPLNVYGKSKYAGERLARQATEKLFIVRSAWLYGDGNNFVRTMLKLGREQAELQVVDDQYGCPTSAADLAEAILRLIRTQRYGTYHAVNRGMTTWHGFARKIFELTGNTSVVRLKPVTTAQLGRPAPRPAFSPLDARLLGLVLGWSPRTWEEALRDYLRKE